MTSLILLNGSASLLLCLLLALLFACLHHLLDDPQAEGGGDVFGFGPRPDPDSGGGGWLPCPSVPDQTLPEPGPDSDPHRPQL